MALPASAPAVGSDQGSPASGYRPGVCNIGPAEIARRRRAGHVGTVVTVALLGFLVSIRAPRVTRLAIALPAMVAASGYLQARLRFCAGFGSRGVFNFGSPGEVGLVEDAGARARDRARSTQIGLGSLAVAAVAALAAVLFPR